MSQHFVGQPVSLSGVGSTCFAYLEAEEQVLNLPLDSQSHRFGSGPGFGLNL